MTTHYIHKTRNRLIGHVYDIPIEVPDHYGKPLRSYRCICVVCANGVYLYEPPRDTPQQAKAKSIAAYKIRNQHKPP